MRSKVIFGLVVLVVIAGLVGFTYKRQNTRADDNKPSTRSQSAPVYRLDMQSSGSYTANKPENLHFTIKDQNGVALKDFDDSQGNAIHLVVISKDRAEFQHFHPIFDTNIGDFSQPVTFSYNGDYLLVASFTKKNAPKDTKNNQPNTILTSDIKVGDLTGYNPIQALELRKTAAVSNGIIASFFYPPNDDSVGPPNTNFYSNTENTILISVESNGQLIKNLEPFHGALGAMTVIGPDLKVQTINAEPEDVSKQTGLLTFKYTFPKPGYYKLFLEIKNNSQVTTFNFALNVKNSAISAPPSTSN